MKSFLRSAIPTSCIKNREFLHALSSKKQAAYLSHLRFFLQNQSANHANPTGEVPIPSSDHLDKIADISRANVERLAGIADSMETSKISIAKEEEILKKIDEMLIGFSHYSSYPEAILNSREIISRAEINRRGFGDISGMMTKSGDADLCYDDFVFGSMLAAESGNSEDLKKFTDGRFFVAPLKEDGLLGECCTFLYDIFSIKKLSKLRIKDNEGVLQRTDMSKNFVRYAEVENNRFRFRFTKEDKTLAITDSIGIRDHFFFGEDIKLAIKALALINSRIVGEDYFLEEADKFSEKIIDLARFELRLPVSIELRKVFSSHQQPSISPQKNWSDVMFESSHKLISRKDYDPQIYD